MPAPRHQRRDSARLVLEDGRVFSGLAIGAERDATFGEVIFNTSMTGYQEIVSDPSYAEQLITFTAPQIGNYGATGADDQAPRPRATGVIVRELSPVTSSWRAEQSFEQWLVGHSVAGISEIDTRALTRHIRERGAMRAGIFRGEARDDELERVLAQPTMVGRNLADEVTTPEPYRVASQVADAGAGTEGDGATPVNGPPRTRRVVIVDFGLKRGIAQCLARRGVDVTVVPASSSVADILAENPDGVLLSNGPGDPEPVRGGIETAAQLVGKLPVLGICLGHQILGLALGGSTFKMRFGHHGGNHPVRDERTGEVWITAQNHGFAVDPETLPATVQRTHVSLYDGTLEGFVDVERRVTAVQFHPEGCPGPSDARSVFDRFVAELSPAKNGPIP